MVEALTIVLAMGVTRGWRAALAGAVAAVIALQLDVATPQAIAMALLTGFISAAIAVARRKLVGSNLPPPSAP